LGSKLQLNRFRRAVTSALLAGTLLSSACSGDDDDDASGAAASSGVGSGGKSGRAGSPSDGARAGDDSEIPVTEGGSADSGSLGGQPAGGSGSGAPHFPCDVEDVIVAKCQRCHQDPPQNGAPFPLLTWEDTRRPHGLVLVFEAMLPAIETDFMPLTQLELEPPVEPLEPEEKELMLEWLSSGAPAVLGAACD
jgi:hypothetical protein